MRDLKLRERDFAASNRERLTMAYNPIIYRPDKFVVGYYTHQIDFVSKDSEKARFGYPSCQWLKRSKWTDVSAFSRLCHGVKPHRQLDASVQIKKDLGMTVDEVENMPITGFRVVDLARGYDGNYHVYILDPRGFHISLPISWLRAALTEFHCSVTESGVVSGKWFYAWRDEHFMNLLHESELGEVTVDDDKIASSEKSVKKFKSKDLKAGTVYDVYEEGKEKTETERYVCLGEFAMVNPSSYRNFIENGSDPTYIARYYYPRISSGVRCDSEWLPWNEETKAKRGLAVLQPKKKQMVFIKLEDRIPHKDGNWLKIDDPTGDYVRWYADTLSGLKPSDPLFEKSLLLGLPKNSYYGGLSSLFFGSDITKRIVGESKDQTLKIIANQIPSVRDSWKDDGIAYTSPAEYKTFPLEMLVNAFKAWLEKLDAKIAEKISLVPPVKPATDEEMQAWIRRMEAFSRKWNEENNRRYRSW